MTFQINTSEITRTNGIPYEYKISDLLYTNDDVRTLNISVDYCALLLDSENLSKKIRCEGLRGLTSKTSHTAKFILRFNKLIKQFGKEEIARRLLVAHSELETHQISCALAYLASIGQV